MSQKRAAAVAHPNIALAKYWGKRDVAANIPATPSVSVTLGGLVTRTTVTFDDELVRDELVLDAASAPADRVSRLLDEVRALAAINWRARVVSENSFPTASGLASSASGFAALARAACSAAAIDIDDRALSRMARRASASAARSIFGGWVALGTEDDAAAEPIAPPSHWSLSVVVATVTHGAKDVGSTEGMEHTRKTSPFYGAWIDDAPELAAEVRSAIATRDLQKLGEAAEASALRMHACAMSARPPLLYWSPLTIELLGHVRALRKEGVSAWATIDAGPHVKVLVSSDDASKVVARLAPHALRIIIAHVGEGARAVEVV